MEINVNHLSFARENVTELDQTCSLKSKADLLEDWRYALGNVRKLIKAQNEQNRTTEAKIRRQTKDDDQVK